MDINGSKRSNEWKVIYNGLRKRDAFKVDLNMVDWYHVINVSSEHGVQCLVYDYYKNWLVTHNQRLNKEWKSAYVQVVLNQKLMNKEALDIIRKLHEEDCDIIGIKGIEMNRLYDNPSTRLMGDLDLMCHEEDVDKISYIMSKEGFEFINKSYKDVVFAKGERLKVEIHFKLFKPKEKDKSWFFKQCFENALFDDELNCKVLCPNDCMTYLVAHMAKHILYSGCGIRPLKDIDIYYKNYQKDIDLEKVERDLYELGYHKMFVYLMKICNRMIGGKFHIPYELNEEIIEGLLHRIEASGSFGEGDEARVQKIYLDKEMEGKGSSLLLKMKFIFLDYERMKEIYPLLINKKWMLFFCWIHRAVRGGLHNLGFTLFFFHEGLRNKKYEVNNKVMDGLKKNDLYGLRGERI